MTFTPPTLEPLADYLRPQFGNIYHDNFEPGAGGIEVQSWTPALQEAVRHFLVHEVTNDDWAAFLDHLDDDDVPDDTRTAQAALITQHNEPWVVAYAFHRAALDTIPTLDHLIGGHETWPNADLQEDVGLWLDAHASDEQLAELAAVTNHPERDPLMPWYNPEPTGWHFADRLTPPALLKAWHHVVGPAKSDLTDQEWELLVPLLPVFRTRSGTRERNDSELRLLRRRLNGMRYKFARDVTWSSIPRRYGHTATLYQRYINDRRSGFFTHLHSALRDRPEAGQLVAWFAEMVGGDRHRGGSGDTGTASNTPSV